MADEPPFDSRDGQNPDRWRLVPPWLIVVACAAVGAAIWVVTLATATAGEMPMKISSGVIRKPPPMPNMPEMNPTASPITKMRNTLTGNSAIGR